MPKTYKMMRIPHRWVPGMNNAFTERLEGLGIKKENIKTDVFIGY